MSPDFWAGYFSGAAGIIIGNPLDIIKVRLQALSHSGSNSGVLAPTGGAVTAGGRYFSVPKITGLARGISPPILTYGPLNALLFVSYNRTLCFLDPRVDDPSAPPSGTSLASIWLAGAVGGLATWIVSAPTESVKCRAQVTGGNEGSLRIAKQLWFEGTGDARALKGIRALYVGGTITSIRDAVGYGFYFWSYELCKRTWPIAASNSDGDSQQRRQVLQILFCGGIAGVVTWASVFPLDVIKTRLQTQDMLVRRASPVSPEQQGLLSDQSRTRRLEDNCAANGRRGAVEIAKAIWREEGPAAFFRGLGVCSARAFIVNAVQWAVYEWTIAYLKGQ